MKPNATRPFPIRLLALWLVLAVGLLGCPPLRASLAPEPGAIDYQRDAWIAFRHGHVNAIGGNLLVRRAELPIDTHLGSIELGAVYNSASESWRWSFQSTYGTVFFSDATGHLHDTSDIGPGQAIPGTTWVRIDDRRMKTKAGRVHTYGLDRQLQRIHWGQAIFPRLDFVRAQTPSGTRLVQLRQCTSPGVCSSIYDLSYDANGRVVAIDDRAGRRAEFEWLADRISLARSAFEVEEGLPGSRYEYAGGLLTAITTSEGERTELSYDGQQVVEIRRIGEGEPSDTFYYGGHVDDLYTTRHWDARGDERTYRYDQERRLHEIHNVSVDETTRWTWNGLRPTSRSNPDGTTRLFTWLADDLVTEVEPSGNVRELTYAPMAIDRDEPRHRPLLQVEDDLGLVEQRNYDALGRQVSHINGAGETFTFSYDALGHVVAASQPSGTARLQSAFGEDGHAQLIQVPGSFLPDQHRNFDAVGNRVFGSVVDRPGPGGVSLRSYDAGRNLREVMLEDGGQVAIDVRSDGQRTRISRPGGDDHEMNYDGLGRLVGRRERAGGVWHTTTFEYDAVGNRTAVERPNGMRQEFVFDAAGRIVHTRNLRNGVLEGERSSAYENGQLVSSSDSLRGGTQHSGFDSAGRLASVQHEDGRWTWYGYDARSRRTSETYVEPDLALLRSIGFGFDGADREIEIRDGPEAVLSRRYEQARLTGVTYGNGFERSFHYDPNTEVLAGSETRDAEGVVVEATTLSRSLQWPEASLSVVTSTAGGVDATTSETYVLAPLADPALGLFTNRARVTSFTGAGPSRDLHYDGRSNLLAEGSTTFVFNGEGNRLLSIEASGEPSLAYTYDEAGFATSRGGIPITWRASGRIGSHGTDVFAWDVLGQPLSSTVAGIATRSIFGAAVVADGDGDPLRIDLDEVTIHLTGTGRLYRHLDFRGNVKFTSDDQSLTRAHYGYSPYGLEQVYGANDDPLRFVARAEIGELMLMGARVYDPAAGRFLSPDPIFQEINQYAYTLGNPVWFHDRDGTNAEAQSGGDTAVVGKAMVAVGNSLLVTAAILAASGQFQAAGAMALAGAILVTLGTLFMTSTTRARRRKLAQSLAYTASRQSQAAA